MTPRNADLALKQLMDGNQRYVAGRSTHPRQTHEVRRALVSRQDPLAIVLGCADARVPPEVIFDQGLGDLFVVRVAGNVLDPAAVTASLEYAVAHLRTPLLIVLGHQACGAVLASVAALESQEAAEGHLGFLVETIRPAAEAARRAGGDVVELAIRGNVERTVGQVRSTGPIMAEQVQAQALKVVGAYYDLASGEVELLGRGE